MLDGSRLGLKELGGSRPRNMMQPHSQVFRCGSIILGTEGAQRLRPRTNGARRLLLGWMEFGGSNLEVRELGNSRLKSMMQFEEIGRDSMTQNIKVPGSNGGRSVVYY